MFGDPKEFKVGGAYQICLVGVLTQEQEEMVTLFRSAKLLQKSGFDTNRDVLLQSIEQLNEECEGHLIHLAECRTVRACTAKDLEEHCHHMKKVYCEDVRLSINSEGVCYSVLYVPPETPPFTEEQKEWLFMRLAGCYDLSGVKPNRKAEVKHAAWPQACAMGDEQRRIERLALEDGSL